MIVKLDENNYFTGSYVMIGNIEGGTKVLNLPNDMSTDKVKAWKYVGDVTETLPNERGIEEERTYTKWVFDEERYNTLLKEKEEYKKTNPTLEEQVTELKNAQATTDEMLINLTYDMIMLQNNL